MRLSLHSTIALLLAINTCEDTTAFTPLRSSPTTPMKRSSPTRNDKTILNSSVVTEEKDVSILTETETPSTEQVYQEQQGTPKSYLDDGFVFGLEGSGIERPKGKVSKVVVEGDSLETQPYQVAMVSGTFIAHSLFAANAIAQMNTLNNGNMALTSVEAIVTLLSGWVLADLGSGILHWSVDNYGNGRTPIMGSIIAAFQGHHSAPWTITERGFCNNVYKLCIPFGIPTMALISTLAGESHPTATLFFTVFCAMEILSQEFHKWSHMTKGECTSSMNWLQNSGLTIDRRSHALHHTAPFEGQYCIVSGICNEAVDNSGFFRRLEHAVYNCNGVESNAWKLDPELKARTLRGEYGLN